MNYFKKLCVLALLLMMGQSTLLAQIFWDVNHLNEVREQIGQPAYSVAYQQLLENADKMLAEKPISVMMKSKTAVSGDKHDYLSQGRYFWPDPTKKDGLPYIRKDGESNPEIYKLDRRPLANACSRVSTLALAYYFSQDEKYAEKAVEQIRVWFLNKDTRMNPNLNYAQTIPGKLKGKGRKQGLIDGYSFIGLLDGAALLEGSKAYTAKDQKALKAWFAKFLKWYLTSDLGKGEAAALNNHGTAYDVQVIAFAKFTDNKKVLQQMLDNFYTQRIEAQIKEDGSQPLELERTLGFGYSQFNLTHIIEAFMIARNAGMEIGGDSKKSLARVEKGLDFLTPYLGKDVKAWPYKQIDKWELEQQNLCRALYQAYLLDNSREDYLQLYRRYARKDWKQPFVLLYQKSDQMDNAYCAASRQLTFALKCVEEAKKTVDNPEKFSPRTMEKDGSLRLVKPRDWCSGFFAGELWQMYRYTNDPKWEKVARQFTDPIEKIKDCRETHDLGFILYNSFGKGYEATGDTLYRNIVIQAAKSLISRYSDKVGAIRSWDHHAHLWDYPVIIDNMINLELLFQASLLTGDNTYYNIAVNHANKTLANHFRKDYSCYHVVSYNPETGVAEKKNTHQGLFHESVWSRGQGWAIYGYTMTYRYTKDKTYLEQAQKVAKFIFGQKNMPEDLVPYWDMLDPAIPNAPRDASAAAVVASALYELATYVDAADSKQYRQWADTITSNLYTNYRNEVNTKQGFLLDHSTGNYPAHDEIDKPINYADYYYLEAMGRRK